MNFRFVITTLAILAVTGTAFAGPIGEAPKGGGKTEKVEKREDLSKRLEGLGHAKDVVKSALDKIFEEESLKGDKNKDRREALAERLVRILEERAQSDNSDVRTRELILDIVSNVRFGETGEKALDMLSSSSKEFSVEAKTRLKATLELTSVFARAEGAGGRAKDLRTALLEGYADWKSELAEKAGKGRLTDAERLAAKEEFAQKCNL